MQEKKKRLVFWYRPSNSSFVSTLTPACFGSEVKDEDKNSAISYINNQMIPRKRIC